MANSRELIDEIYMLVICGDKCESLAMLHTKDHGLQAAMSGQLHEVQKIAADMLQNEQLVKELDEAMMYLKIKRFRFDQSFADIPLRPGVTAH